MDRLRRTKSVADIRRKNRNPRESQDRYESCSSNSSNLRKTLNIFKMPTLKNSQPALVNRRVLEGGFWGRLTRKLPGGKVHVEPYAEYGLSTNILYAPAYPNATEHLASTETSLVNRNEDLDSLVYAGNPFEIRVVGMQVEQFDRLIAGIKGNELILWSTEKDGNSMDLPFIHFDWSRDGIQESVRPDQYVQIPESNSFVTGFKGSQKEEKSDSIQNGNSQRKRLRKQKRNVEIKFRLVEVDGKDEYMKESIKGVNFLNNTTGNIISAVPYIGLIRSGIIAGTTAMSGIFEHLSAPDNIMSLDVHFSIADRGKAESGMLQPGKYLRYGYYFFLRDPCDAQLYASVTTPEIVRLMLKQDKKYLEEMKKRRRRWDPVRDKQYFPLKNTSYIVIRVSEPTGAGRNRNKVKFLSEAHELDNIMRNANDGLESPNTTRRKIIALGQGLGVFDTDSEPDNNNDLENYRMECSLNETNKESEDIQISSSSSTLPGSSKVKVRGTRTNTEKHSKGKTSSGKMEQKISERMNNNYKKRNMEMVEKISKEEERKKSAGESDNGTHEETVSCNACSDEMKRTTMPRRSEIMKRKENYERNHITSKEYSSSFKESEQSYREQSKTIESRDDTVHMSRKKLLFTII